MKVIKAGKSNWKKQVRCSACHAELEIEESDVTYKISDEEALAQQYKCEVTGTFSVTCPECQKKIKVTNIPPVIQAKIVGD